MASQRWVAPLAPAILSSKTVVGDPGNQGGVGYMATGPATSELIAGSVLTFRAWGTWTATGARTGFVSLYFNGMSFPAWGGTPPGATFSINSGTDVEWSLEAEVIFRTVDVSGQTTAALLGSSSGLPGNAKYQSLLSGNTPNTINIDFLIGWDSTANDATASDSLTLIGAYGLWIG